MVTLNFENTTAEEPKARKEVIAFLLNYSKSLEVVHTAEIQDVYLLKNWVFLTNTRR